MKDYFDCQLYMNTFWPEDPYTSSLWEDNKFLLFEYTNVASILDQCLNKKYKCLDISTGPILIPVISFAPIIESLQLSEYSPSSQKVINSTPIQYWSSYTKEILVMEGSEYDDFQVLERLNIVKKLVSKRPFISVDLMRDPIFPAGFNHGNFNLFTMHFVADSITASKKNYYFLLGKVLSLLDIGDTLIMSVLIECSEWKVGNNSYPSPNLSIKDITTSMKKIGLEIMRVGEQFCEYGEDKGHNGRMAVVTAARAR